MVLNVHKVCSNSPKFNNLVDIYLKYVHTIVVPEEDFSTWTCYLLGEKLEVNLNLLPVIIFSLQVNLNLSPVIIFYMQVKLFFLQFNMICYLLFEKKRRLT